MTGSKMGEEDDEIINRCRAGISSKLPFLIEEREEAFVRDFFSSPSKYGESRESDTEKKAVLLSLEEKTEVLKLISEKVCDANGKEWWMNLKPKSRAQIILFMSESFNGRAAWSCVENAKLVSDICRGVSPEEEVGKKEEVGDLSSWFSKNLQECVTPSESDFHSVLLLLKGKFQKCDWKYYPASVHGFGWILHQIKYPFLGFEVDMIIPPALLFTDDYYDEYKLLGLNCLSHIVKNVDKVDLTRSNWANVVYDAVKNLYADKDHKVIKLAMKIIMKLLQVIEVDPAQNSSEFTRYDGLLKQIIFEMEITSDVTQKKLWFQFLDDLIKVCGTASLHWSDRICEMLRDSTVSNDYLIWNSILEVASTLIKNTWLNVDCEMITEIVLRILLNLSTTQAVTLKESEKEELTNQAAACFKLLQKCEGFDKVDVQISEITEKGDSNLLHPDFIATVKNVRLAMA